MKNLAKNYKNLMKEKGYDFEKMGEILDLHPNSVRNTANGTRKDFPLQELLLLAEKFKMDALVLYAYLFDFQVDKNYTPQVGQKASDAHIAQRLSELLEKKGMRVEYLATSLNGSTSHARDILRDGNISVVELTDIALRCFKINPLSLLAQLVGQNYRIPEEENLLEEPYGEYNTQKSALESKLIEDNARLWKMIEEKEQKEKILLNMLNDCYQKKP